MLDSSWNFIPANGLTMDDMHFLGTLLGSGALQLEALGLHDVRLGDEGVTRLFDGLGHGPASLCVLNLGSCAIGPDGASILAAAFDRGALPKLKSVGLGMNRLGPEGASRLAEAIDSGALHELEHLELCLNALGDQGLASLAAPVAERLPALRYFGMRGNNISREAVAAFLARFDAEDRDRIWFRFQDGDQAPWIGRSRSCCSIC